MYLYFFTKSCPVAQIYMPTRQIFGEWLAMAAEPITHHQRVYGSHSDVIGHQTPTMVDLRQALRMQIHHSCPAALA
jgi:hypothetical protein